MNIRYMYGGYAEGNTYIHGLCSAGAKERSALHPNNSLTRFPVPCLPLRYLEVVIGGQREKKGW